MFSIYITKIGPWDLCSLVAQINHMDTDMDMDMEYGPTWGIETLYIPSYPYGHGYGSMFTYYHCYIL